MSRIGVSVNGIWAVIVGWEEGSMWENHSEFDLLDPPLLSRFRSF